MRSPWTISLRELLALAALVGAGSVALRHAGERLWLVLSSVAALGLMTIAVLAVTRQGGAGRWSRGFAVCVLIYGALVYASRGPAPQSSPLPTTVLLARLSKLHEGAGEPPGRSAWEVAQHWSFPESDLSVAYDSIRLARRSPRPAFLRTGHLLIALLLGLAGGKLALAAPPTRQPGEHAPRGTP